MTEAEPADILPAPPQVSVIIPAFNAASYLERSVASAQRQGAVALEILIIDDRSQDDTLAVARALAAADPRIRVIAAERNGGPAAARNRGLTEARGAWIALLDADDGFEDGRLSRLLGLAQDCGAELLADNLLLEDENGRVEAMLPASEVASCAAVSAEEFLRGNLPDPKRPRRSYGFLKPLIYRPFLLEHGLRYDESLRFAEDFAFYLACFAGGARFFLCQEPLYRYRLRSDSLTACHSIEDLRRLQQVDTTLLRGRTKFSAEFRGALELHKKSIDQRLQWRVFIEEAKDRSWRRAASSSLKGWHVFQYIFRQLIAEIWRRLWQRRIGSSPA